jgi:quinol-cytochrome oxidoreductase complex cytochrome b subunit
MPPYPLTRTWIGAICAVLAIVLSVLGLLGIAPADAKIFFLSILLLAIACLA